MNIKQIEKRQAMESVKFETAKKIRALLDEAKADYKAKVGESDMWDEVEGEIIELVVEGEIIELVTEE